MLSAIAYVTTCTGERPFAAINRHVSPVLGWAWLLASLSANMFWCLPQYSLAAGVLEQNLLPEMVGPSGSINAGAAESMGEDSWMAANAGKLTIVLAILLLTTTITWAYDSGSWGIKLYELLLKLMVAGIVLCFFGVIVAIRSEIDWGSLFGGFIPDFSQFYKTAPSFAPYLESTLHDAYWEATILARQRRDMIAAAATAVGINMTFLFPYSILAKRWTKEFRGMAVFDLSTGMFIPFVLATSCVVIAAANRFHAEPTPGLLGERDEAGKPIVPSGKAKSDYNDLLHNLLLKTSSETERPELAKSMQAAKKDATGPEAKMLAGKVDALSYSDRRMAAMLAERDVFDLAKAISPLAGDRVANIVFGLGVLGMALSTITLLMLISGFCVCEALGLESKGWAHRLGTLAATTGALGPFYWSKAAPALANYVSAFGLMLLPIAYWAFFFLMNRPKLLGDNMPRGVSRAVWNVLMFFSASVATVASVYVVFNKLGWLGVGAMIALVVAALVVQSARRSQ
jgi:hypothetical protein